MGYNLLLSITTEGVDVRHTDAQPGRTVKVKKDFSLSGDMSIPVERGRIVIRRGTRGRVIGNPLCIGGNRWYVPVKMGDLQIDVRIEYLELA